MNFNFFDQSFHHPLQPPLPSRADLANFQIPCPRNYDKSSGGGGGSSTINHHQEINQSRVDPAPPQPTAKSKRSNKHNNNASSATSTSNYNNHHHHHHNNNNNNNSTSNTPSSASGLRANSGGGGGGGGGGVDGDKGSFYVTCDICFKRMRSKQSLAVHIKTHTKPHSCQICGKTYAHKFLLTLHEHAHFEKEKNKGIEEAKKRFKCTFEGCDTAFNAQCRLTAHMKVHEGAFRCDLCHRSYSSNASLARHERVVHGQEKPYKCPEPLCGKSFCHPDYLTRHLRSVSHTGLKRFPCRLCEKSYASQRSLNYHLLSSHAADGANGGGGGGGGGGVGARGSR